MAGCSSCGHKKVESYAEVETTASQPKAVPQSYDSEQLPYAPASADKSIKVLLKYNGGGYSVNKTGGCSTCHGGTARYSVKTNETIMFISDDEVDGIFSMQFAIGHSYYVTEEQAKYLLTLTYRNRAGQISHKFTKVEE